MRLSVRTRISAAVGLVGAAGFAAIATFGPGIVRASLENDLLESEAADADATLALQSGVDSFDGVVFEVGPTVAIDVPDDTVFPDVDVLEDELARVLGIPAEELTEAELETMLDEVGAIVGEAITVSGVADSPIAAGAIAAEQVALLEQVGRFDELVEAADGSFVVALGGDAAALVEPDGTVSPLADGPESVDRPVMTASELDEFVFDDLGFVEIAGEGFAATGDGRVVLRSVTSGDIDHLVAADITSIDQTVTQLRRILWIAVPVLAAIAAGIGWLLASRALRPVGAITERTASITGGTLDARVPEPGTGDEIAELASTMNGMLDRLQSEDERRRRFVSDASHELRTPVTVMRNEAEVALLHPDHTSTSDLATAVADEATRLSSIIDDLLALARHDEGTRRDLRHVDLDEVLLAEAGRTRRVPVSTKQVSAGRVAGHPDELGRLVGHLLDNAARHAATAVAVSLTSSDAEVILRVDDDGPGIDLADRDAVFERFTRLDEARSRDAGGAGLGLSVVRQIALRSGATVHIEDARLGGASFVVTFPPV